MTKVEIMNSITRSFHRGAFQIKKHSPEILLVTGIVGVVSSAIMACRATTKLQTVLEESKNTVNQIHEYVEKEGYSEKYTEEDKKKDLAITYTQAGVKLVKLYGPSIALGALSVGCILTSHNIIHKRNMALAAAYTAVDTSFKDYRKRVIERFGKELDRELKYNIKAQEVEETVQNEDGTETVVKKTVEVSGNNPNDYSIYARCFDETCPAWDRDSEYNLMFLVNAQNYANDRLKAKGRLFLNEVYDMLGFQRSKAGQVVGWVYDEAHPVGDNYVDFGIHEMHRERSRAFVNGYEKCIWLDFNVDGNILELMQ